MESFYKPLPAPPHATGPLDPTKALRAAPHTAGCCYIVPTHMLVHTQSCHHTEQGRQCAIIVRSAASHPRHKMLDPHQGPPRSPHLIHRPSASLVGAGDYFKPKLPLLKSIIPHSYARFIPHHTTDARHRRHGTTAPHQSTDCVPQHTQLWLLLHCAYTHACAHPVMASHSKIGVCDQWWCLVGFTCVCGGTAQRRRCRSARG